MSTGNLYFIAIIPNNELCEKINTFKYDFARRFNSQHALKVMPHITLKAPFKYPAALHQALLNWFERQEPGQHPFIVELKNFGMFPNSKHPVVFVRPVENIMLNRLQHLLISSFGQSPAGYIQPSDKKFSPHITIAYRDLTPANFEKAWEEYSHKGFEEQFEVNAVHLLQHNGTQWNIIASKPLASK